MTWIEKLVEQHRLARYAFVLASFPIVAIMDRVSGIDNPIDAYALRNALAWARRGGDPARAIERPAPAPMHPKWQQRSQDRGDTGSHQTAGSPAPTGCRAVFPGGENVIFRGPEPVVEYQWGVLTVYEDGTRGIDWTNEEEARSFLIHYADYDAEPAMRVKSRELVKRRIEPGVMEVAPSDYAARRQAADERVATRVVRPACTCCGRRVGPLNDTGRCGHCGENRQLTHDGDKPCRNTGSNPSRESDD